MTRKKKNKNKNSSFRLHSSNYDRHVPVHGMTRMGAGEKAQPNLSRFSVANVIRTFREEKQVYLLK